MNCQNMSTARLTVSCVMPGIKYEAHITDKLAASGVPTLSTVDLKRLSAFYHTEVAQHICGGA